jgi:enoyl-CoA hydratase
VVTITEINARNDELQNRNRLKEKMHYDTILTAVDGKVATITLNRPQVLNALNDALMDELGAALLAFDADDQIGCIIITGSEKAFAAGADIAKMAQYEFHEAYRQDFITRNWETIRHIRKPVIAAVNGYALGGGCELAMMCDMIIAGDGAKFGQPEVKLGILPGAGGTQRLPRAVSKSKAMDLCLTGRMMDAQEAERAGLVSRIFPAAELLAQVGAIAKTIADMPLLTTMMVKESINAAYEMPLSEGIRFERRLFHSCFGTDDQKEGMAAFMEKRAPQFKNS